MAIYVTGDCHSDFHRFSADIFYEQKEMNPEDKDKNVVIICGDFGGIWYQDGSKYRKNEEYWLDWLEKKSFTVVFCDGNHENFDRLYSYPIKEWNGGKVHEIRPHVFHLMRGEVFNIEEKKFFVFGGASSHDIRDGILERNDQRIKDWDKDYDKQFRINHLTWWKEELPSEEEMDNGLKNLEKYNNRVDYIITHCASCSAASLLSHGMYKPDKLTRYLEEIRNKVDFSRWFMGHYHENRAINDKEIILYEQIIRIL